MLQLNWVDVQGGKRMFKVIEGGLGRAVPMNVQAEESGRPSPEDVRQEAARRLSESGCHLSRIREFATGMPMLAALKHLSLQIDFAAEALSRLDPIPEDFRSDGYWPAR
ncbi:hypothetical protein RHEC894_CH03949 [Rhizobium sp. CIAT894]|uniref:hypothetical protein n=1 Tax=Rhizobium sp. CIAT894 TaxID=2020312 RepID=UPI000A1DF990|nr:hypothetical protein [Rhizobium sp. CIAT894]ARM90192.1 hypothetical protein RHEC894_CH03949 [Rhizobium sp. CIAT894]